MNIRKRDFKNCVEKLVELYDDNPSYYYVGVMPGSHKGFYLEPFYAIEGEGMTYSFREVAVNISDNWVNKLVAKTSGPKFPLLFVVDTRTILSRGEWQILKVIDSKIDWTFNEDDL